MKDKQPWEIWFDRWRGSELAELAIRLTRQALHQGHVTAEDAHSVPVQNPNIRGAAMRSLRRLGILRKAALTYGTTEASHGHAMFRWELADSYAARALLQKAKEATIPGDRSPGPYYPQLEPAAGKGAYRQVLMGV